MQRTTAVGVHVSWRLILRVIALILFVIATFVALGDVQSKWDAALIPAGLAFLTASLL